MSEKGKEQEAEVLPAVRADLSPATMFGKAEEVARVCAAIVQRTAKPIQGKKFVCVEGWEAIAIAHGCAAGAGDVERVYDSDGTLIGYKAMGYVRRQQDGCIIATGEGFVGFDEKDRHGNPTWGDRAEYAGRAMAQTRAISRACRSAFAHIVVMIGADLSTTPAEEVPDNGFADGHSAPKPTTRKAAPGKPAAPAGKPAIGATGTATGLVKGISERPTKRGGVRYGFLVCDEWYNTFDAKFADLAKSAKAGEREVRLDWKAGQYGLDVTGLDLAGDGPAEPSDGDPAEDEPPYTDPQDADAEAATAQDEMAF